MHKLLLALLLCLAHSTVFAQAVQRSKSVTCDRADLVFRTLIEEFRETPVWHAIDLDTPTQYVILANKEGDTWTLVQYDQAQACILGVGRGSRFPVTGTPV